MQSESVEIRILLSWSDELTIYTLLPLHRALHVAHVWPNSKYEDINEILYRPSIIPGGVAEQVWGGGGGGGFCPSKPPPPPPQQNHHWKWPTQCQPRPFCNEAQHAVTMFSFSSPTSLLSTMHCGIRHHHHLKTSNVLIVQV